MTTKSKKHKQLEFDFGKNFKTGKQHNKQTIRGYRKQKLRLREEDSRYDQLNFSFYNE